MRYWFDTEFIERGPSEPIRLLSIGMIAEDGREFYYEDPNARRLVNEDHVRFGDRWLIENVRPFLFDGPNNPYQRIDPKADLIRFCDPQRWGKPEFWAYFADYDWVVLCQVFGRMIDLPKGWPMWCRDLKQSMWERGVRRESLPPSTYFGPEHFALNDAKWARLAWQIVTNQSPSEPDTIPAQTEKEE